MGSLNARAFLKKLVTHVRQVQAVSLKYNQSRNHRWLQGLRFILYLEMEKGQVLEEMAREESFFFRIQKPKAPCGPKPPNPPKPP